MTSRFTQTQKAAVRELLGLPGDLEGAFMPIKNRLAVTDIRRALHLPPIPYCEFLGPNCWLAGGRVLRWLCSARGGGRADETKGDFDFFFPSLKALNVTARAMMARGFQLRGYLAFSRNIREYLRKTVRKAVSEDRASGIWDEAGGLAPITSELSERLRLSSLELRSPEGDRIQLVAFFQPTPLATILQSDISICQLAVDDQHLSFGPWAWSDLLHNRFRVGDSRWPDDTFRRMFKYARRGFWPYPRTVLRVSHAALAWLAEKAPRSLFAPAGIPSAEGSASEKNKGRS